MLLTPIDWLNLDVAIRSQYLYHLWIYTNDMRVPNSDTGGQMGPLELLRPCLWGRLEIQLNRM